MSDIFVCPDCDCEVPLPHYCETATFVRESDGIKVHPIPRIASSSRPKKADPRNPKEAVDHPDHYGGKDNPYETIKVLKAWLTPEEYIGFLKGNVIKYLSRARQKNGTQDVAKATWYQNELNTHLKEYV